jgi:hypothetical protein
MTATLTQKIIKALGPDENEWTERRELADLFPNIDYPRIQKELHNLVQRGVLELKQSDSTFSYRVRKQKPSTESTTQELIDSVLAYRAKHGLLREGDKNRMRLALQQAQLDAAKQNIELEETVEELAKDRRLPDLSYEDFKQRLGLDHD